MSKRVDRINDDLMVKYKEKIAKAKEIIKGLINSPPEGGELSLVESHDHISEMECTGCWICDAKEFLKS